MAAKRERCWDRVKRLEKTIEELNNEIEAQKLVISDLKGRLSQLEAERDEYLHTAQRAIADYDNLSKRVDKIISEKEKYGDPEDAKALIGIYEELEMAVKEASKGDVPASLKKGMELVLKNFIKYLEARGIKELQAEGVPFDPNYHEAMMSVVDENAEEGTVVKVLKKGYMIHDKVLLPAKVVVSRKN